MEIIKKDNSLARFFRQLFYVPMLHTGWLTSEVKNTLTQKVTDAEKGHRGEVYLVIENALPLARAYHLTPRARAVELFATSGVWDTEENTGVLVYVNLCEHDLEVVADRGIDARVEQDIWQGMCLRAISQIKDKRHAKALSDLLDEVGELLRIHYHCHDDPSGNELPDRVVHLR